MLRLVSCPKSFVGSADEIQRRAIESWKGVSNDIVLAGPAPDIETVPPELGVRVREVPGRSGISPLPLFSDLMEAIDRDTDHELVGYLNADILLPRELGEFRKADRALYYRSARLPDRFLLTGRRWDLAEGRNYRGDFRAASFADFLREQHGDGGVSLHDEAAMDFFVFPRHLFRGIGPLIVGRGAYDNALLAFCLRNRIPVIDLSRTLPVLHQFHGHDHMRGGKRGVYLGEESRFNRRNHGIERNPPNLLDCDYRLDGDALVVADEIDRGVLRHFGNAARYRWELKWVGYATAIARRVLRYDRRFSRREATVVMDRILGHGDVSPAS